MTSRSRLEAKFSDALQREVQVSLELNVRGIIGTPDIVHRELGAIVFVHGCYWHSHRNCAIRRTPVNVCADRFKTLEKIVSRDQFVHLTLLRQGWRVITVWECSIRKNLDSIVVETARALLNDQRRSLVL